MLNIVKIAYSTEEKRAAWPVFLLFPQPALDHEPIDISIDIVPGETTWRRIGVTGIRKARTALQGRCHRAPFKDRIVARPIGRATAAL